MSTLPALGYYQNVMIFVDQQNYYGRCRDYKKFADLKLLRRFLANEDDGRILKEMVVYFGFPPQMRNEPEHWERIRRTLRNTINAIAYDGIMAVDWEGKPILDNDRNLVGFDANIDVLMAVDAFEFAVECRPDVVVLVTADGHFSHLAQKLRRRGIRVEVAGPKREMSNILQRSANDVIDLDEFITQKLPTMGGGGGVGSFDDLEGEEF